MSKFTSIHEELEYLEEQFMMADSLSEKARLDALITQCENALLDDAAA